MSNGPPDPVQPWAVEFKLTPWNALRIFIGSLSGKSVRIQFGVVTAPTKREL